ncbi:MULTISPECIES: TIGR04255 family protein [Nostocales]|uniref:TIGR04255 family protein n=3 Tax=Nostocales TaxID=1161 RepID=A0A0C1N5C4_9CYAN|nr:TIGR04255 family protein [Tolypothrix bouteillei]KAF3888834.1 TIGR04255 family protein [Tolypothrix bouteillei VB521301]
MKLPNYERVIYEYNPLIEVIAQLRFPTILRITSQQPVDFQDSVRFDYPIFEASRNLPIPNELSNLLTQFSSNITNDLTYHFKSEDLSWQLSIDKDSITLVTTKYERYENFIKKFKIAVEIFEKIYNPSFYSRVGLRYRDLIIRSKLNIQKEWAELIPKHIASELYTPEIADSLQNFIKNLQIKTEFGQVNFNHGLVMVRDTEKAVDETAYLLDADFFTEGKIERGEYLWNILNQSNRTARNLFRWSITDDLYRAMRPQSI